MSFKCEICEQPQQTRTKVNKIVTAIRNVIYPVVKDNEGRVIKTPRGFETVSELNVCDICAEKNSGYVTKVVGEKVLY